VTRLRHRLLQEFSIPCDTGVRQPYIALMAIEGGISGRRPMWTLARARIDWDTVYAAQLPRVYNFFRYRVGDDATAEDLTSRTFEKAWIARNRYKADIAGFSTWLFSIARNVAIDHLRSCRQHLPIDAADELADADTPERTETFASDIGRLNRLVRTLPKRDQEILALKYGAEATNRAIAELLGLSESNVGTILHRAVAELRRCW
jgi:RNA polymerase sigma-70 factor, ECF subfamily